MLAGVCSPKKKGVCTKRNFQSCKLAERKAGRHVLQPDKKTRHTLEAFGEEKINISTISSGQASHAPQDGFRWITRFPTS